MRFGVSTYSQKDTEFIYKTIICKYNLKNNYFNRLCMYLL